MQFYVVVLQLRRFRLKQSVLWSLGDSCASGFLCVFVGFWVWLSV